MKFIDEAQITVSSGKGGAGCISFRRESHVPRGGPDGGTGGRGGHVIFKARSDINSLLDLRYKRHYAAGNGRPGEGSMRTGADGDDVIISVPVGTVVKDSKGQVIADFKEPQEFVFLEGGRGGQGNVFFKSSINQAPEVSQPGEPGEERDVQLELKLIADVGLVGYPNAGKSTLLSRVSAAKPKIADYPFTTLTPQLGVVRVAEEKSFVVADIPGLIEGAHEGVGLGIQFLKHIERTCAFVHVVDISEMSHVDPIKAYDDIRLEMKSYDEKYAIENPLSDRKEVLVLNKADTLSEEVRRDRVEAFRERGLEPMLISAVSGEGIKELIFNLDQLVHATEEEE